jgi:chromosome segregation ATPase
MLDTIFTNGGQRKQAQDDLRTMLEQAREERMGLAAMLEQINGAAPALARASRTLDDLRMKTDEVTRRCDKLSKVVETHAECTDSFEQLEVRMNTLLAQVGEARRTADAWAAPEGELRQMRQAADDMGSRSREVRTTLNDLQNEGDKLEALRERMRQATAEMGNWVGGAVTLKDELQDLRRAETELRLEMQGICKNAGDARGDCEAVREAVTDVQAKLESLGQLKELSKSTEQRLTALNALAEHVAHKSKALEAQKIAVERAVVEAARLNEMVWNMDTQIAKLTAGGEQIHRTEEVVARTEQLASEAADRLAAATAARDDFLRESRRLEEEARSMADAMRTSLERISVDKKEVDAFEERLKALAKAVGETESRVQGVLARDEELVATQRQVDGLARSFTALAADADELARKQIQFDALSGQLVQLDALGKRTAAQHETLLQSQADLDNIRVEIAEFHRAHAEAAQLRDKLALDRTALDAFGERTTEMLGRTPELQALLDEVLGKMALVEKGCDSTAKLGDLTNDLDAQIGRVTARLQFIEKVELRVNSLHEVASDVENKLAAQLARRAEMESAQSLCDTLSAQVTETQQKLEGVAAMQVRVLPLASHVAELQQTLERTQQMVEAIRIDEALVHEQQARLAGFVEQGKTLAAETTERLNQVRGVSADLARATALKEELLAEVARMQATQLDAVSQTDAAEERIQRADALARQLEQRIAQLMHSGDNIATFEGRLGELDRSAEAVERKIQSLADHDTMVQAVKAEVDNIRQISGRSRADLQYVTEHRGEVVELRSKVEDLIGRLVDTDGKIVQIESRRKVVEEVQSRAENITHMLDDIHVNLEMLSGQRAVIDDVGEKLARLDFTVQEAQNTLRALQREREMAERIEQGMKALRARSGTTPPK